MTYSSFKKLPKDEQRDLLITLSNKLTLKRKDPLIDWIDLARVYLGKPYDATWSTLKFEYNLKRLEEVYQHFIMEVIK